MSEIQATVLRYEEQRDDHGEMVEARLTVEANARPVSLTVERVDEQMVFKGVNDQTTTLLERESIPAFRAAVDELERRGIDPDLAGLAFAADVHEDISVASLPEEAIEDALATADRAALLDELDARGLNPGRPDSADEAGDDPDGEADDLVCEVEGCDFEAKSSRGRAIHETKAHGDDEECWCGICGAGPFDSRGGLGGHHSGAGHDGDSVALDHKPDPEELVDSDDTEETVDDDADEADVDPQADPDAGAEATTDGGTTTQPVTGGTPAEIDPVTDSIDHEDVGDEFAEQEPPDGDSGVVATTECEAGYGNGRQIMVPTDVVDALGHPERISLEVRAESDPPDIRIVPGDVDDAAATFDVAGPTPAVLRTAICDHVGAWVETEIVFVAHDDGTVQVLTADDWRGSA